MKRVCLVAAGICALSSATVFAGPVNGTGNVTPDAIFGSGNANGSFTGVNIFGLELGLRGKLRYDNRNAPAAGGPLNTFNYDGDRTYTFSPSEGIAPAGRSLFNFEWSINVDSAVSVPGGDPVTPLGRFLDDLTYLLTIDFDPSAAVGSTNGTDVVFFDPITQLFADHSIGNNATANGGGTEATTEAEYATLIGSNNVAQNSWNLGFFEPAGFDPQTLGIYTMGLQAFDANGGELASTSIDIVYGDVPAPATLALIGLGLAGLGYSRRKKS